MVTRAAIVAEARSWVNVPFRHMGRSRMEGVDCIGLPLCVAAALGIPFPDYPGGNYTRRGAGFELVRHCVEHAVSVRLVDARDGDVIVFTEGIIPCHVGILFTRPESGLRYVVQAYGAASYRKVVETPWKGEWAGKARYAFTMPGTED